MESKKVIIFDSSSIISISLNGLLEEFKKLKEQFDGYFMITSSVKREIVEDPIQRKRFEFEAMKIKDLIDKEYLVFPEKIGISGKEIEESTNKLLGWANTMFFEKEKEVKIIQEGEASCIALGKLLSEKKINNLLAIDERTTRMLIEKPENLKDLLKKKLHLDLKLKKENFEQFKGFKVIRSAELMYVAYRKNIIPWKDKNILEAIIYALKFKGCAISEEDIKQIKKIEGIRK